MIEKAVAAEPDSGAIVDSPGLGLFPHGRLSERGRPAGAGRRAWSAADPDINDHLGDAYWHVGRDTEARYQWERVLTLSPDAKLRERGRGQAEDRPGRAAGRSRRPASPRRAQSG